MNKLITVEKAKAQVKILKSYIRLVESYEADTLEKQMIKEYAYFNSIEEVAKVLNERGYSVEGRPIVGADVSSVIKLRSKDELHKIIRSGYLNRTKHSRQKIKSFY